MSVKSAEAFVERMKTDAKFRTTFLAAKDEAARCKILKETGFDYTLDELRNLQQSKKGQLSDADLAKVAGGVAVIGECDDEQR